MSTQSSDGDNNLLEQIATIKKAIWEKRPVLGEIIDKHGDDTLYEYSKDFLDVNPTPQLDARKDELLGLVQDLLKPRLGAAVAQEVADQLKKKALISTADHHGIIDHPYWVNANIISALPIPESNDTYMKYNVVFSFASVSVNNASAYPRGILFHGGVNDTEDMIRLPFLADKYKMSVVYAMRGYTKDDFTRAKQQLNQKVKDKQLTSERAEKIKAIIETYCETDDVLQTQSLSEQITKINYKLWPALFHSPTGSSEVSDFKVDLIHLEIETIISEALIQFHLNNPNSLIHKLLFEPNFQKAAEKYFNNLAGSFSIEDNWGTHFFWAMDEKLHRVGLKFDGKRLYNEEENIHIPFTPEDIAGALKHKRIFPNMFLCYLMTAFYYGMKCMGGFSQVNNLTLLKTAWQDLLKEIGETQEAEAMTPIQTRELNAGGVVLSYMETGNGKLLPATGIDMILEPKDTRFEQFIELSKKVTLNEMMTVMLPRTYSVLYSAPQRDETLAAIPPSEILKQTRVEHKLRQYLENIV